MVEETKVTHDNNGRFYRIKMDLAKEGSEIWDLTPYFKGRVGDNRFGLQVVWTYQGRLLDTTGMKPYIEGNVGNYSFDDKKDLQLAPDAATVRYTGNPSDCQSGGRATYYFPEQMFPRDGIFKGYIGLLDDRDDSSQPHISGVTVWFRVLPGIVQMGHACDVYISDLDKALQNFKVKLDQHDKDYQTQLQQVIDDARNTYNTEVSNAHDALIALQAELSKTREDNNNLSDLIQSVVNNIKTNNVVTRPEYDKLANEIVNRLSQINTTPNYYDNYNDMLAANPNGTQNLCVTSDNQHKWLFVNGSWVDLGEFSYADLAPIYKNLIYQPNPDNLVINSDFKQLKSLDFTDVYGWSISSNASMSIHPEWGTNGSNCLNVAGHAQPGEHLALMSGPIQLGTHQSVSFGCGWNGITINNSGNQARMELMWLDAAGKQIIPNTSVPLTQTGNNFNLVYKENIAKPENAVAVEFCISFDGGAEFNLCRPQINFDDNLIPYQKGELNKKNRQALYKSSNDNLLLNPNFWDDLNEWTVTNLTVEVHPEWSINGSYTLNLYGEGALKSTPINVANKSTLSFSINRNVLKADKDNQVLASLVFFDTSGAKISSKDINLSATYNNLYPLKEENISIPSNAATVQLIITLTGKANVEINQPQLNFGKIVNPFNSSNILNYNNLENLAPNYAFKESSADDVWEIDGWKTLPDADSDDKTPVTLSIHPEWGTNGFNCLNIIQYLADAKGSNKVVSDLIPYNRNIVSYGWLYNGIHVDSDKDTAFLGITFYDQNKKVISSDKHQMSQTPNYYHPVKFEGISVPEQTAFVQMFVELHDNAQLNLACPQLNQGDKLIKILNGDLQNDIEELNNKKADLIDTISIDADNSQIGNDYFTTSFTACLNGKDISGFLQIAWQGDSSRIYPKKNFKIKLFKDQSCTDKLKIKPRSDWDNNNKFNLKANWIDATQARNLVNSELFAQATAITKFENNEVEAKLSNTQNLGQMEGFPIEVYLNGNYQGLYTFNTKKDEVTFGMDKKQKGQEAITCEKSTSVFRDLTLKLDGQNYATVVNDTPDADLVLNFQKFQEFINNSTDSDFKQNLKNYTDVTAWINCYLFGNLSQMYDFDNKSVILLTYNNGAYFYPILYDYDSTWNLMYDGSNVNPSDWYDLNNPSNNAITQKNGNKLYERLYNNYKDEIVSQYKVLRNKVWSNMAIIKAYKDFIRSIPEEAYEKEQEKWTNLPSKNITDFAQIQQAVITRGNAMDSFMEHFADSDTTSPQPITPQTGGTTTETPQAGGTTTKTQAGSTTPTGTATAQQTTQQAQPTEPKQ